MAILDGIKGRQTPQETVPVPNGIIGTQTEGGMGIITLSGKITKEVVDEIYAQANEILWDESMEGLFFDMKNVTYIGRGGITMFAKLGLKAGETEKMYQLMNLRADIAEMFQMMGYAAAFSITVADD